MKKAQIILLLIFGLHLFLRFYQFEDRNPFGWDQVDSAWAAKNILVDHQLPLLGIMAKGNSGFSIGPAYYYLIAPFYFIFNLDPIASGVFAGATSLVYFLVLFYITKRLFSVGAALVAVFLNAVSFSTIYSDRVQGPVNFIPLVSLIIFYCLYKIATGKERYLLPLSLALGFSFHIHFTSVFYPLIILLTLPFFPRTVSLLKHGLMAAPLFLVWFIPHFVSELQSKGQQAAGLSNYLATYYHGFHVVRMTQLMKDAFIQFEGFLIWPVIKSVKYLLLPLFSFVYFYNKPGRERVVLIYLMVLWFVVPWLVFTTYSGEISDYYFLMSRPIALLTISYLFWKLFRYPNFVLRGLLVLFLLYYSLANIKSFLMAPHQGVGYSKSAVREIIRGGGKVEFRQGDPGSYIYYFYTRK